MLLLTDDRRSRLCALSATSLILLLIAPCSNAVQPVWRTPVSQPHPASSVSRTQRSHSEVGREDDKVCTLSKLFDCNISNVTYSSGQWHFLGCCCYCKQQSVSLLYKEWGFLYSQLYQTETLFSRASAQTSIIGSIYVATALPSPFQSIPTIRALQPIQQCSSNDVSISSAIQPQPIDDESLFLEHSPSIISILAGICFHSSAGPLRSRADKAACNQVRILPFGDTFRWVKSRLLVVKATRL